MKSSKETYVKYHVKRDPQTLKFVSKDGEPVPGEKIKNVRITDAVAETLNESWKNSGHVYLKATEKVKKEEKPEEKEEKTAKDELWETVKNLVAEGKIEKMPHHATGEDKLKELIENAK